eukprot:CAMPEP_0174855558 /NCGR_PEP_ID=MMETSP1114-20130205/33524_1 /TAXON_ID=312471 /ORGANISM="Neobodo designis, Strain CCAP 1951/1" /LENGTH=354 /DNA_ID=CAMNT_0016090299 /DNA_START=89 /DNA_END=1150 /DNA_ORIENTATION=+
MEVVGNQVKHALSGRGWRHTLLPSGYPQSTATGFVHFCGFQATSAVCSAAAGTIATTALLSSFFTSAAALGWLLKDMLPNAAAVLVANQLPPIDDRPHRHFVHAQTATSAVVVAEVVLAQYCPAFWLPYAAAATSFIRAAAMIRTSSSRASMLQHFALRSNMGDLQSKLQSWVLISYTLGACVGAAVVAAGSTAATQFGAVCLLSMCSIALSAASGRVVSYRVLNMHNIVALCTHFVQCGSVPTPQDFAAAETSAASEHRVIVAPIITSSHTLREVAASPHEVCWCVKQPDGSTVVLASDRASNANIVEAVLCGLEASDVEASRFVTLATAAGWVTTAPVAEQEESRSWERNWA